MEPENLTMTKYIKVSALGNDIEYEKIGENEVRFHRRWKKVTGFKEYFPGKSNYSHYSGTVIIPERVTDVKGEIGPKGKVYTVTELGTRGRDNGAFFFARDLREVSVPGTVKVIFDTTFEGCSFLHKLTLNEGIEEIEGGAFFFCETLHAITIPNSVKKIGENAFAACICLTEVTIGTGLKTLYGTFSSQNRIEKVTCLSLEPPVLNEKSFTDKVYDNAELFVPYNSIEDYKRFPFWRNFKKISSFDAPPKPVTPDPPTPVTPDPPKPITPDPPKPVTPDPPTPVTPPEPKKPGDLIVFKHVGVSDNQMEYTIIDDNSVSFHERIVSKNLNQIISNRPDVNFSHYRGQVEILDKVVYQDKIYNVVQLGSRADYKGGFYQALELNKVSVPGTVKVLFDKTFYNCVNLYFVILHEGLKEIGESCFFKCQQLSRITIPDSVSTIGKNAFSGCVNLEEVTLGNNINDLDNTFSSCRSLRKVTCRAITPPNIVINAFEEETYHLGELLVPYQSLEQYKNHSVWGKFNKISSYDTPPTTETPPKPETPKNENFVVDGIRYWVKDANAKVAYITDKSQGKYKDSIAIPQMVLHEGVIYQVLKVGNYAFKDCKNLNTVIIPNTIKGVNDYAFANTPQLRSIHCYATTPPEVKPKSFDKVLFDKITLYVPKDTVSAYKSAEGWKNFVNILPLDS